VTRYWMSALLALAAGAAQAEAASKAAPATQAKPKLVCFSEPNTGSHIRKRTCITEEEAAARRKRDQEAMANMRQKTAPQAAAPGN